MKHLVEGGRNCSTSSQAAMPWAMRNIESTNSGNSRFKLIRRVVVELGCVHHREGEVDRRVCFVDDVDDIPINLSVLGGRFSPEYSHVRSVEYFSSQSGNRRWYCDNEGSRNDYLQDSEEFRRDVKLDLMPLTTNFSKNL